MVLAFVLVGMSIASAQSALQPAAPLDPVDCQVFATSMRQLVDIIHEQYVKPVRREALAIAAMEGLYEAAQAPLPGALVAELRKTKGDELEIGRIFFRAREKLGSQAELKHPRDLRICLRAILATLDPHSVVMDEDQLNQGTTPTPTGIGIIFESYSGSGPLRVKHVTAGSPAQRAGLMPGDRVTHLNGTSVEKIGVGHARYLERGTTTARVERGDSPRARQVSLKPETFRSENILGARRLEDNTWDYWLDRECGIAHIRLDALEAGTAEDLLGLVSRLVEGDMKGLILDLRWCPGGSLLESRQIADLFLAPYGIGCFLMPLPGNWLGLADLLLDSHDANAQVRYRDGRLDHWGRRGMGSMWTFPMVVLVNGESSGGAELIAGVLQDHRRARIAGQRTRGKGSVQSIFDFRESRSLVQIPGMGMKLSTGILVRPSGRNLHRFASVTRKDDWGVDPDPGFTMRVSPDYTRWLREQWIMFSLRPFSSLELLPLDDPVADPQREEALGVLRRMMR